MPDKALEEEIKTYLESAKKSKVSKANIYSEFKKKGYPDYVIEYYLAKYFNKKHFSLEKVIVILIGIAAIAFIVYLISSLAGSQKCTTTECFTLKAENCEKAGLERVEDGSTFNYKTNNCVLTKTAAKISDLETSQVKSLLEGKSLTCTYQKNNFNMNWLNTLTLSLDKCQGPLKDGLMNLLSP